MSCRSYKEIVENGFVFIFLFAVVYGMSRWLGMTCLIRAFTGTPCPTCCMSRALLALVKGDFADYARHNIMALPTAIAGFCDLFGDLFGKHKKALYVCTVVILAVNLLYYLIRLRLHMIG